MHTTHSLTKRYSSLSNNLIKFEGDLRVALLKWQTFQDATASVLKWIKNTEKDLQEITLVSPDVSILYGQVTRLKVIPFEDSIFDLCTVTINMDFYLVPRTLARFSTLLKSYQLLTFI